MDSSDIEMMIPYISEVPYNPTPLTCDGNFHKGRLRTPTNSEGTKVHMLVHLITNPLPL